MFSKTARHLEVDDERSRPSYPLKLILNEVNGNLGADAVHPGTRLAGIQAKVSHLTDPAAHKPFNNLLTIQEASKYTTRSPKVYQIVRKTLALCRTVIPFSEGNLILNQNHRWRAVLRKTKRQFESIFQTLEQEGYVDWMFDHQTYLIISPEELRLRNGTTDLGKMICYPVIVDGERAGIFIFRLDRQELDFSLSDLEVLKVVVHQAGVGLKFQQMHKELALKEQALKRLNKVIVQSARMAMVGELASGITHEINNPLQVILGKIQLAMIGGNKPEVLKHIEQQSLQIASLVRTISDLSKTRSKDSAEVIEVNSLIANTIDHVRRQMERRRIRFVLELAPQSLLIQSNSDYLRQIILNTILDAKKRILTGGNLTIRTLMQDKDVRIEFRDNAPGKKPTLNKNNLNLDSNSNNLNLTLGEIATVLLVREIGGEIEFGVSQSKGKQITITLPQNIS